MTVQSSFNSATNAVDAIDTLNAALTAINSLTSAVTTLNTKVAAIPPLASLGAATLSQNEGNSGTTAFVYLLTLDKPWASDISYEYVVSGTGSNPTDASDFVGGVIRGVVTVAAGATSANVTIPVAGDTKVEQSEAFIVRLYRIAAQSLGTILNDDTAAIASVGALVGLGDSILAGTYTSSHIAFSQLGYPGSVVVTNLAVSGQTFATNYSRMQAGDLDQYYTETGPSVLFMQAGTNDLASNNLTGSQLYAIATNAIALAKSKGFYTILQTVMKRRLGSGWTSAQETERQNYNALVAANSAGADYVLDLRNDATFGEATAFSDSTNSSTVDGLHASNNSQDAWAPLIKAKTDLALAQAGRYTPQVDLTATARSVASGSAFATPLVGVHKSWTTTATSSDGAALTVANGVLSGTFASTGAKTVTFVETPPTGSGLTARTSSTIIMSAAEASNYVRFTSFATTGSVETVNAGGGYDYGSSVAINNHSPGISGRFGKILPANTDGWGAIAFTAVGGLLPFMGFSTNLNPGSYTGYQYAIFSDNTGNYQFYNAPTTSSTVAVQAGDHVRVRRVGTNVTAEYSRDGGLTWTVMATWTGTSGAALAFSAQPSALANATIKAPYTSTAFA